MKRILLSTIAVLALAGPAAAQSLSQGWFVIVGSYSMQHIDEAGANTARVMMAAHRCGFNTSVAAGYQFANVRPGVMVQFIGAYATEARAAAALYAVRPCIKDAYIKHTAMGD